MSESFTHFIRDFGQAYPPRLAYNPAESLDGWLDQLRAKVRELLGPVPPRVPLKVTEVKQTRETDHTRHLLHITVTPYTMLPAYLLIPRGISPGERRAGVLVLHGHARYGIDEMCAVRSDKPPDQAAMRAYALRAVDSGFVVLTPAWWGWSGRDAHVQPSPPRDKCNVIQMAASMYGVNVLALHMQDATAALDVLASHPEVDPQRIGCMGNSYGGRMTMWLTALDDRVKACVPSGCMNTFRERSRSLGSCGIQYPFGLLAWCDTPEVFCLIAPRAMQLQAGQTDGLINTVDRDHIAQVVRDVYHRMGVDEQLEYVLGSGGHWLMWEHAEAFLRKHLAPT